MADTIVSRGPDDFGIWFDAIGVGLAHRRLSILDLSPAGQQPMMCPGNRFVITFNGEIYNHLALRAELEKRTVRLYESFYDGLINARSKKFKEINS